MAYYKQIIVLLLLVQMLTSCWARYPYDPNTESISSNYRSNSEELDNNDNTNSNTIKESDLLDKFLPTIYRAKHVLQRSSHFGNQERMKKFLHDSSNLQGLWALPGRHCFGNLLDEQLNFDPSCRYSAVNRLYETYQIALNLKQVDDDYFKLIIQPNGTVLSVTNEENTPSIETQESNGDITQHRDIIPTGEKDYFRIKTRSKAVDHIDFMFLQVTDNDTIHVDLARRDDTYLGQQWRFV